MAFVIAREKKEELPDKPMVSKLLIDEFWGSGGWTTDPQKIFEYETEEDARAAIEIFCLQGDNLDVITW